ncbi:MAG: hypothetical protein QOD70_1759 [Frankiales bacterium]|jgi:hypothetical protein|nr:hypothetical protein [Frankiales bacterium]
MTNNNSSQPSRSERSASNEAAPADEAAATARTTPGQQGQAERPAYLTVEEACADIGVARSTWDTWKALGKTPQMSRLPNGQYRIRPAVLDQWMISLEIAPEAAL